MPRSSLSSVLAFLIGVYALGVTSAQTIIHVPGTAPTIQAGILMATDGDVVQVGPGSFTEATIDLGGRAITVRGDTAGTTIIGTFLFVTNEPPNTRLEGLSLQSSGDEVIRCTNSSPTIVDCEVSGQMMTAGKSCVAVLADGASAIGGSTLSAAPLFSNCRFLLNTTSSAATATVDLMAVSHGGGAQCAATFSKCRFSGNSGGSAGAVRAHAQVPLLALATNTPLFLDCVFDTNTSLGGLSGAVALSAHGTFALTAATLANCMAFGNHGGASGALTLLPIGLGSVSAKVIHCSLNDNAAVTPGNGNLLAATGSTLVVWNSIIRGTGQMIAAAAPPFAIVTVESSNVSGGYPGSGNMDVDPLWVNASVGELHLFADSPCIDAGDSAAPFLPLTDIDDQTRSPATADMGADEAFLVGTFEDFTQTSLINNIGLPDQQEKDILEGDLLTLFSQSPGGSFFGGSPVIAAQFWGPTYTNGVPPASPGGYPELHINPFGGFILKAGGSLGPIPYGFSAHIPAGAGLGGVNCRIQSIVVDPSAANQQFAASHTLELSIQ